MLRISSTIATLPDSCSNVGIFSCDILKYFFFSALAFLIASRNGLYRSCAFFFPRRILLHSSWPDQSSRPVLISRRLFFYLFL